MEIRVIDMATYNAIRTKGAEFLAQQDDVTKLAAAIMDVFHARRGFDWWFEELETRVRNEIFDEVRRVIEAKSTLEENQALPAGHIKTLLAKAKEMMG